MGEFDLPEPVDLGMYDAKKSAYETRYENIAITLESRDNYPIHNFDDINVAGPITGS